MALARSVSFALSIACGALLAGADRTELAQWTDGIEAEEGDCRSTLHLLQRKSGALSASTETMLAQPNTEEDHICERPWCPMLTNFTRLFDSNNPWKMQEGLDLYSEYASWQEGIKLAVTKDHFYEMYHGNVARKLSEYLPQRLFFWEFGGPFETVQPSGPAEVTVTRNGTITFHLGWWRRRMFWNAVIKALPNGENFPYSHVSKFSDCTKCPAKMVFKLKNGGLKGDPHEGWKVVGLSLIKLA